MYEYLNGVTFWLVVVNDQQLALMMRFEALIGRKSVIKDASKSLLGLFFIIDLDNQGKAWERSTYCRQFLPWSCPEAIDMPRNLYPKDVWTKPFPKEGSSLFLCIK